MRVSSVWREWESGDSLPLSLLRMAVLLFGLVFLGMTAVLGLPWPQQAIIGVLTVAVAVWLDRGSSSYVVTLTLMLLSVYSTVRYGFWRVMTTAAAVRGAESRWAMIDAFFMLLLLAAECYAFAVLLLGYMQIVWPLRRTPVPLPDNTSDWPAVDVLIPTFNEPLEVVRFTVLAALNMDWPAEKLKVYLLDDGGREELREFARQAGAGYLTRDTSRDAKAGNLNAALERVNSPFVVVFDADHVPTRSFLQVTMGWFLRDAQLGILQTPHHFYSPDPFERNLGQFRTIPNEDELFYGVVQDGNDFWNATYFCGSCAVLRRSALDDVGGMATDTVTEDAHTSMRMQRLGWNSAYINIPQAAGLATERLSAHVRQRIRWARGMVQILRIENPMFGPGLTLAQRLCYLNAMSHFLYAVPRLIFLTAPLMYLIFGYTNIPGYWAAILAYAAPHLLLSRITRSRMQGRHRHSFWTEIYETVLAPYLVLPTLGALLRPKRRRSSVTPKGGPVKADYFDRHVARPTLVLLACNWFGLCCSAPRLVQFPSWQVPAWASFVNWPATLYDPGHLGTISVNAAWTVFNLMLLGVALGVAWESQQRRRSVRVETRLPAEVVLQDGSIVRGVTADLSSGGVRTTLGYDVRTEPGDHVELIFPVLDGTATLPGTVVSMRGRTLQARFDGLTLEQYEALTMILYARADRWLGWGETREPDRPVRSFVRVLRLAMRGLRQAFFGQGWGEENSRQSWASPMVPVVLLGLLFGVGDRTAGAQNSGVDALEAIALAGPARAGGLKPVAPASGPFHSSFTLAQAGVSDTIALRGASSRTTVGFALPQGALPTSAVLRLKYSFSPHLLPGVSSLRVMLNGTPVATIPVIAPARSGGAGDAVKIRPGAGSRLETAFAGEQAPTGESSIPLPAELLARRNELGFEFTGHYTRECEDPTSAALWTHVSAESSIEWNGISIPLQDDLGLLPAPFYQPGLAGEQTVQLAFLQQPSLAAMRAAAIVTSWFGVTANSRPVKFAVTLGRIPAGNVVLIAEGRAGLPVSLNPGAGVPGEFAAMRANPVDATGKVLVVSGSNGEELVRAAAALANRHEPLRGSQTDLSATAGGVGRIQRAPRWLETNGIKSFAAADVTGLEGDGSQTESVYLRLPPDLYLGGAGFAALGNDELGTAQRSVPLHLKYRYNGVPLADGSALQVWANGTFIQALPLRHSEDSATTDDAVVAIPAAALRPFSNTLSFRFAFEPATSGGCAAAAAGGDFRGSILKDSYLDLQGVPHWTELPNLELFADAGYPFTREADLGGTTVVLPGQPKAEELELFFALMGHFGAETGTPVTGVEVAGPDALRPSLRRDLLVLGTAADQPGLRSAAAELPVKVDETGLRVRDASWNAVSEHAWWKVADPDARSAEDRFRTGIPDALMESAEWPAGSRRSMVLVALRDEAASRDFVSAFLGSSQSNSQPNLQMSVITGRVAALQGGVFTSYRVGGRVFTVGRLPLMERAALAVEQFPWLIAAASVILCFLIASLLRTALRRGARVRLQGNS